MQRRKNSKSVRIPSGHPITFLQWHRTVLGEISLEQTFAEETP